MLKTAVKRLAFALAPGQATAYFAARSRAHAHRFLESRGCPAVNDALTARLGDRVLAGPFQGLKLPPAARAEQMGPVLLGHYEAELHPAWDRILTRRFSQAIDVGSKYGYYAVGLARRLPESRVVAFDCDPWARRATRAAAAANGVTNVDVLPMCDAGWLADHLQPNALILSDCEGFEDQLFRDAPAGNLATATVVVETHDFLVPGVTDRLMTRFSPTHDITRVGCGPPPETFPVDLSFLTEAQRFLAVNEIRPEQAWLVLEPRRA